MTLGAAVVAVGCAVPEVAAVCATATPFAENDKQVMHPDERGGNNDEQVR